MKIRGGSGAAFNRTDDDFPGLRGDLSGGELHAEIGRGNETIAWIYKEITRVNETIARVNHEIAKVDGQIASVNQEIGVVMSKIEVAERNVMDPYISMPEYWLEKEKQLQKEKTQLREKEKQFLEDKKQLRNEKMLFLVEEKQLREKERQLLGIFDDKRARYGNLVLKTDIEGIENMKCDDHASTDRTHRCYVSFLE